MRSAHRDMLYKVMWYLQQPLKNQYKKDTLKNTINKSTEFQKHVPVTHMKAGKREWRKKT